MRKCPVRGCDSNCMPKHLMCSKHWNSLPKVFRDEVWDSQRTTDQQWRMQAMREALRYANDHAEGGKTV